MQNTFVRGILRVVDVLVSFYLLQPTYWEKEPFRKATGTEKRFGACFMVVFPLSFLIFLSQQKKFDRWVDSMMQGHHSIIWLYLAFIGLAGGGAIATSIVAPKIPLSVSIPVAAVAWTALLWFVWSYCI